MGRIPEGLAAGVLTFDDQSPVLLIKHSDRPLDWEVPGGVGESP